MKLKHLLLLSGMTLLASCTDLVDEEFENNAFQEYLKIKIDGGIDQQYITRVDDGGFCYGDQIGLYGVNYENKNTTQGTLLDEGNQVDNIRYTLDEETGAWTSSTPAYYKDLNTNIDLYAYYPYGTPHSTSEYEFEVEKDQQNNDGYPASDFLWAKAENVVPSENKVKLHFTHRLSCANVILKEGEGFEENEFDALEKSVLVMNTTRAAQINLATGVATAIGEPTNEGILMMQSIDGFRAVVVPQTIKAQTTLFAITVNGISYRFSKAAAFDYEAGMQSKFTITIDKKEMEGEYTFTLTDTEIVEWEADIETHGGEARQYYVVQMETPGTLGELIAADNKNPNKIKNLKISGKVDARDFFFMRDNMEILQAVNMKECKIEACWSWIIKINGIENTIYVSGKMPSTDPEKKELVYESYPELIDQQISWGMRYSEYNAYEIPKYAFYESKTSLVHFTFPEKLTKIGAMAFQNHLLSGALIIPNDVMEIGAQAFSNTNITSLELPHNLKSIGGQAFYGCKSLSGTLSLPESLESLGENAFSGCILLSGPLFIPSKIKEIPSACFSSCNFIGDLIIPEGVTKIGGFAFNNCNQLNGRLLLPNSLKEIGNSAFRTCHFQGELTIPAQLKIIPSSCFAYNQFSSIIFPENSEIFEIEDDAFAYNRRITEPIFFPKELFTIGRQAFYECAQLPQIVIPSMVTTISESAFGHCYGVSSIICEAQLPPILGSNVFNGVAKDNFTLEVPKQSVVRYQMANGWGDFKRISAHYDFGISRATLRTLNESYTQKYILRVPAGLTWSIQSKPEWVTVFPNSGVGKTDVTITISEMASTEDMFETTYIDERGTTKKNTFNGRAGEIVFLLDGEEYTSTMKVEQYNYGHADGEVIVNHSATRGNGVNIVFMGDCFDARDIATGKYLDAINEAIDYYFDIEPYKSYKDYFNIYTVIGMSPDTGMGTVNTIKDAKFGSQYSLNGITPNTAITYEYAMKAETVNEDNLNKTLVVMVENTTDYGGICYMWGDGSAIAICPMSRDAYPYDFRGIVQHEAGGHGFAKLADEYIYHNAFIEDCSCTCCDHLGGFNARKALGWYRNLSTNGDMNSVEWAHLIFHSDYSDMVDMYEGGYYHTRGIYRSEATSCMNNNIPYYSAIQRQEMVERIMEYAGETFSLADFYAKDVRDASNNGKTRNTEPTATEKANARKQMPPRFMGNKPALK